MTRFGIAAALAAIALPVAAPARDPIALPSRLGTLVREVVSDPRVAAAYAEMPRGPGTAVATVSVRPLGRSAAEDLAANEEPLRTVAGVTAPGPLLAQPAGCTDVVARIDHGVVEGAATVTGSLYALRGGQNIKLRVTAAAARGVDAVAAVLAAFRTDALGCAG